MNDDDLKALIEQNLTQALGRPGSVISQERERNLEAYLARPEGIWAPPEVEDRSDFVSTDVADTVEWMLPSLLRIFASSQKSIEVDPKRPQFEGQKKLVEAVLRHYFWDKCNGFQVLYNFLKDGLLQKVGFVKVRWEEREVEETEEYEGLMEDQLAMVLQDDDVEVVEQQERQIEVSDGISPPQPVTVYDIKVKRVTPDGCVVIDSVPPEEMRISNTAVYTNRSPHFIAQVGRRVRDELEAEGFDTKNATDEPYNEEEVLRAQTNTDQYATEGDADYGGENIRVVEAYQMVRDRSKKAAELKRCIIIGQDLQEAEPTDDHAFVWWCPVPLPHVFFGSCPADQALSPQVLHTNLIRAVEDNVYLSVNARTEVPEPAIGKDTINDLLQSRPGGVVRTKVAGMLQPLVQPDLSGSAFEMVEWTEQWLEKRTGFSRISKGLSPDTLNTETATGVLELTERADMRTELIARHAANALEWMLTKVLKCLSQYQDVEQTIRINGEWVSYDPREWANHFTVRVNVGMGAGNKDRRAMAFQTLSVPQAQMIGAGVLPREASVTLMRDWAASMGEDNPEKYFPDALPPAPPPPDPKLQIEQMKQQGKAQEMQLQAQLDQQSKVADIQAESQREQIQVASAERIAINEQEAQARQELVRQQVELQMAEREAAMEARMQAMQNAFEAQQNERDRQLQLVLAQIKGQQQAEQAAQQRQHEHIQGRMSAEDAQKKDD